MGPGFAKTVTIAMISPRAERRSLPMMKPTNRSSEPRNSRMLVSGKRSGSLLASIVYSAAARRSPACSRMPLRRTRRRFRVASAWKTIEPGAVRTR